MSNNFRSALATPYEETKLHMARNIFYIHEMVRKVILSDFFVEGIKITPFNGSNCFKGSKPFLTSTRTRDHVVQGTAGFTSNPPKVQHSIKCTKHIKRYSKYPRNLSAIRFTPHLSPFHSHHHSSLLPSIQN
jgi:hypothetical protein